MAIDRTTQTLVPPYKPASQREEQMMGAAEEFLAALPSVCVYHNRDHTIHEKLGVVAIANCHATFLYGVSSDRECIVVAAAFHDTGYIVGPEKHEEKSAELLEKTIQELFGLGESYSPESQQCMRDAILDTKYPYEDKPSLWGKILRDADMDNLGRPDFFAQSERVATEFGGSPLDVYCIEGLEFRIDFLRNHEWETSTAAHIRQAGKQANIELAQRLLADARKGHSPEAIRVQQESFNQQWFV